MAIPKLSLAIAVTFLALAPAPSMAAEASDPDTPRHGLRFADLEFAMPTDPLLWSSDPGWKPHPTSPQLLADARQQLRNAVPAGTPVGQAAAILRRAGARCAAPAQGAMVCRYDDLEMPYGGDYHDNITWTVTLAVQDDQVGDLAVRRDWTRR